MKLEFSESAVQDLIRLRESHYILMINGSFDVVTNRNSLTETALRILNDDDFVTKIKQFFDLAKFNIQVFRELIDTLNKQKQDVISLKKLLDKTFNCEWFTPPPTPIFTAKKGKKK
ncbi:hypothetical protein PN497_20000 [Sphaerospermopsis kisseleviana CS-549]|uniref:Uncharacterized protein n=1 Tax=Sphaerospermopsis kisseleviana CS-549 TaxID=3021783 RepID=A0ABT4ZY15_9CYAN|nr:hypothetical protein [Sphaerospermopsis kisseleviana]MDB9443618.1 hypothetical protein [Sphaerospermopsis kisseleviana CS-549]BAZ81093.1 hypothetical protein NIES73_23600 [Sphaerospermopsis kisseleviana NIES-73]